MIRFDMTSDTAGTRSDWPSKSSHRIHIGSSQHFGAISPGSSRIMSNRINAPDMQVFGELDLLTDILADSHRGIVYARRWLPGCVGAVHFDGHRRAVPSTPSPVVSSSSACQSGRQHTLREGDIALVAGNHVIAGDDGHHAGALLDRACAQPVSG